MGIKYQAECFKGREATYFSQLFTILRILQYLEQRMTIVLINISSHLKYVIIKTINTRIIAEEDMCNEIHAEHIFDLISQYFKSLLHK